MTSYQKDIFDWSELLLYLLYVIIVLVIGMFIKNKYQEERSEYRYFLKGMLVKMLGALIFISVYLFYYGDGDTFLYFKGGRELVRVFLDNPLEYFRLLFSSVDFDADLMYIKERVSYAKSSEEWFTVKMASFMNMLAINRFSVASLLTSLVGFYGSWKMFQAFLFFFPKRQKEAFWSVFLFPSVIFWGSGILKDTFSFAAMGIFTYLFVKLFFEYKFKFIYIIGLVLATVILFNTKVYILIAFFPSLLLGWIAYNRQKIKSQFFRVIITPLILVLGLSAGIIFINKLLAESTKYKIETLKQRTEGFHSWHTTLGGSSYSLGEIEYTPLGLIKKLPAALEVTYFRPYFDEVRNVTTALGSIESFAVLLLFILMIIRQRLNWVVESLRNPFLLVAFSFSIIMGFIVGFTSYNFGALARYKIPVMPYFMFIVFYFNATYRDRKRAERLEIED